jgi:hypothetical protein
MMTYNWVTYQAWIHKDLIHMPMNQGNVQSH